MSGSIKIHRSPEEKRTWTIVLSLIGIVILLICLSVYFVSSAISQTVSQTSLTAVAKTQAADAVETVMVIARTKVVAAQTQTAALPANTSTYTVIPSVTDTSGPSPTPSKTSTPTPTKTRTPTITRTPLPYVAPTLAHPAGTSGRCRDGQYTSAQHRQGACSSHGGIAEWWGP